MAFKKAWKQRKLTNEPTKAQRPSSNGLFEEWRRKQKLLRAQCNGGMDWGKWDFLAFFWPWPLGLSCSHLFWAGMVLEIEFLCHYQTSSESRGHFASTNGAIEEEYERILFTFQSKFEGRWRSTKKGLKFGLIFGLFLGLPKSRKWSQGKEMSRPSQNVR